MAKKIDQAMSILSKEEYRRRNLKIKKKKYIGEIKFLRKLIRSLLRKVSLFKIRDNKYPVILSRKQVEDILINSLSGEDLDNFNNQIKVQEENNDK